MRWNRWDVSALRAAGMLNAEDGEDSNPYDRLREFKHSKRDGSRIVDSGTRQAGGYGPRPVHFPCTPGLAIDSRGDEKVNGNYERVKTGL